MTLNRLDKEFRHEGISYLDYKQVEMDRVLTAFLPRLWWGGQRSVISADARPDHRGLRPRPSPSIRSRSRASTQRSPAAGWRPICWTW